MPAPDAPEQNVSRKAPEPAFSHPAAVSGDTPAGARLRPAGSASPDSLHSPPESR